MKQLRCGLAPVVTGEPAFQIPIVSDRLREAPSLSTLASFCHGVERITMDEAWIPPARHALLLAASLQ